MSSLSTAKFLPQFKLGTKAVLCAVLLIAVNTALVVGAGYWSLTNAFNDRALRDIEVNLRTLALAFAEIVPDAKITVRDGAVARAEIPKMPEFRDHAIVDRAVSYVGGNATLFVFDEASGQFVRRSTNVKKENGDRAVGTQLAADHPAQAGLRRGEAYKGPAVLFGKSFMTAYFPVADATGKVAGILYVGIPMAQFESMLTQAISSMAAAAGFAALLVLILTLLIVRRVTRPLTSVTRSLTALANGQSDVEIDCEDRADEIGEIARTVAVFKSNSLERARMRSEQAAASAAAVEQRKADLRNFVEQFRGSVGGILDKVLTSSGEFERVARQLTDTARSTADLSAQSAGASEDASEHVRSAASASDELSQSISEITRRVQESNEISAEAVRQAEVTDQRIAQLSEAGTRIGDVVKLITSIAEQTNLLALNATIEAARAGDAGRGFAVVAQEVKTLAGQTAKATDEISNQIASMQLATEESVAAIRAISQTIERISGIAGSISAAVEQQKSATHNIVASVRAAVSGTAEVAVNVRHAAKGASETGETSSRMFASAQALSGESLHLKAEVDGFLERVHAA
ncbi:methyl-accepting chemotaxis protein [Bradyrhizobium diazoefficiens]|uniref:Putative Methyl-accepting chemotaxis protein tlpC n=2 Tax=Bradyrhizobium diazoefficiens TaxID=1355477 RepID=A0A837CP07_9BRAD|nr:MULTISPECIES: Cache 3/Cache 2 fusion domain-containing protein [Bradyrhizobium]APO52574.1 chemotaxis protein [Bradyrhizobium diazoefficiens]KGJ70872.1 putative Methyl-accepting chemotaxis protein tlpC [Bradyrhizobium diazoefficiens SEMIA 5080]KOY08532.1 chemotaxis protein [Bradyrhizobium diazoefficiens]MBR0863464.1 Cache 3/Cache 2 fusion domain-containing protein [Bradyrhizobium diazoefficiens]MBR0888028.1 Cache 3/Cache 2 fusion domain-containing protein [Bradyrhizobium diazoefficiens]